MRRMAPPNVKTYQEYDQEEQINWSKSRVTDFILDTIGWKRRSVRLEHNASMEETQYHNNVLHRLAVSVTIALAWKVAHIFQYPKF